MMNATQSDDDLAMTVEEFREILFDVSSSFRLLGPIDLEDFSFYLLQELRGLNALDGFDRSDYVQVIEDFLSKQFPAHRHSLLLDMSDAAPAQRAA